MSLPTWQTDYKYSVGSYPDHREVTIAEATADEMKGIICDLLQGDSGFYYEGIAELLDVYKNKILDEYFSELAEAK